MDIRPIELVAVAHCGAESVTLDTDSAERGLGRALLTPAAVPHVVGDKLLGQPRWQAAFVIVVVHDALLYIRSGSSCARCMVHEKLAAELVPPEIGELEDFCDPLDSSRKCAEA